jgi:hypothetical protein
MANKKLGLEWEGGITSISLRNAQKLVDGLGKPDSVELTYGKEHDEQYVTAFWNSSVVHSFRFTGFGWGYGGEGPCGLQKFLNEILGLHIPFEMQGIARMGNEVLPKFIKGVSY